jgi:hypothetical protein
MVFQSLLLASRRNLEGDCGTRGTGMGTTTRSGPTKHGRNSLQSCLPKSTKKNIIKIYAYQFNLNVNCDILFMVVCRHELGSIPQLADDSKQE